MCYKKVFYFLLIEDCQQNPDTIFHITDNQKQSFITKIKKTISLFKIMSFEEILAS